MSHGSTGERESDRAQEKMRRAQEKLERKLEAHRRRAESRSQAATDRRTRRQSWGFEWPAPPPPPAPPKPQATEEERLMILRMLEQKKITLDDVKQVVGSVPRQNRWEWFDMLGDRQFAEARASLPVLLDSGETGVGLIIGMGSHFIRLGILAAGGEKALEILRLLAEGRPAKIQQHGAADDHADIHRHDLAERNTDGQIERE